MGQETLSAPRGTSKWGGPSQALLPRPLRLEKPLGGETPEVCPEQAACTAFPPRERGAGAAREGPWGRGRPAGAQGSGLGPPRTARGPGGSRGPSRPTLGGGFSPTAGCGRMCSRGPVHGAGSTRRPQACYPNGPPSRLVSRSPQRVGSPGTRGRARGHRGCESQAARGGGGTRAAGPEGGRADRGRRAEAPGGRLWAGAAPQAASGTVARTEGHVRGGDWEAWPGGGAVCSVAAPPPPLSRWDDVC